MMDAEDIFDDHETQLRKEQKKVEQKETRHSQITYTGEAQPITYAGGGAPQPTVIHPIKCSAPKQPAPKQNPCVPRQPFARIDKLPKQLSIPRMKVKR